MPIRRKKTRNVVIVMSGIPSDSSLFDLKSHYLSQHVPSIGSHYVVHADGDVDRERELEVHGNVDARFNRDSVFIELMGETNEDITPQQRQTVRGIVSRMEELYGAEELDLTL